MAERRRDYIVIEEAIDSETKDSKVIYAGRGSPYEWQRKLRKKPESDTYYVTSLVLEEGFLSIDTHRFNRDKNREFSKTRVIHSEYPASPSFEMNPRTRSLLKKIIADSEKLEQDKQRS